MTTILLVVSVLLSIVIHLTRTQVNKSNLSLSLCDEWEKSYAARRNCD